jgi:hypothetical protein
MAGTAALGIVCGLYWLFSGRFEVTRDRISVRRPIGQPFEVQVTDLTRVEVVGSYKLPKIRITHPRGTIAQWHRSQRRDGR